ncbi:MAG: hypothetical protein ACYTGH_19060 [Planctomycetota bacterium]|jgi:hypothetical protein
MKRIVVLIALTLCTTLQAGEESKENPYSGKGVIKHTVKLTTLKRFKALPERNAKKPVDPKSPEGKKLAEKHRQEMAQLQAQRRKVIASNPKALKAWVGVMKTRFADNTKAQQSLSQLATLMEGQDADASKKAVQQEAIEKSLDRFADAYLGGEI